MMAMIYTPEGACFEYRFKTTFEETNLVGNIYFSNCVLWQGKCREMFLVEMCPTVIDEINNGLSLITLDLSVRYISQLFAFDTVVMRMFLEAQSESRLLMNFKYYKEVRGELSLACEGTQAVCAMRKVENKMIPVPFPNTIHQVFEEYEII